MTKKEEEQFEWMREHQTKMTDDERKRFSKFHGELVLAEYHLYKLYKEIMGRINEVAE